MPITLSMYIACTKPVTGRLNLACRHLIDAESGCADAPLTQVHWCQLYQAKMVTSLGSSSQLVRSYMMDPEVMAYGEQVLSASPYVLHV